jgi:peptide/nickel transport system substrate-binding protein
MKRRWLILTAMVLSMASATGFGAEKLEPVPEINFVTWTSAKYMSYYETSSQIAEEWKKLGLKVNLNSTNFPNPMVSLWFREHKFDCILSVLSGLPERMEPDFFTNAQFNSAHTDPGNWNVGEWKNPEFDKMGQKQLELYDPQKRRDLIYKLQEVIYNEQPDAVILYPIDNYAINTTKVDLDYVPSTEGIRAIWNYARFTPKGADKVLKMGRVADQTTWNPLAAVQSDDFFQLRLVYDRLVQVDNEGGVKMWVAESVKNLNETTIEVTVKKGLKFHDGRPLTANDVKFSYEYMKKWEAPYFTKYLEPIKEIELVDSHKMRFHLKRPYAPFIMNTLGQVFILPEHVWKEIPEKQGLKKPQEYRNVPLVGSGMFKLDYWKEGQEFMMVRNADHFMAPKADILTVIFGSSELVMSALKKGTLDISYQIVPPIVAREFETEKNIRVFKGKSCGYMSVRFHAGKAPFNNSALRVALSHLIPYDRIIKEIYMGDAGMSASTIVPVNAFWHNKNLKLREFSLEKAKAVLREAGFRWDDQGRLCYPPK